MTAMRPETMTALIASQAQMLRQAAASLATHPAVGTVRWRHAA